ncbi:SET domain-containing protein [Lentinus tigrinus ALCF2SS1-7]|uniref:SET domain-containing protein n=1 Tax=Lentinus tigrinus ALCF2SS1-6 TaxID=1328759 RepID=A0A5C2RT83_9APHY|nr:SET domain-containing protein [Lentinus tigrinus ALCF2SS1-6]RPD74109.1 SET domain-containing protein [Lentinus tigrinus ALCF2SS1-7]
MVQTPYILSEIAGKGQGLVATRPIAKGELVLAEAPLFTQPLFGSNATILAALTNLSDANQRLYFSLANAWMGVHPPPLGIFKTNALPCGDHDESKGVAADTGGLFPLGSRFNSSCEPNITNYWDANGHQITFWAVRDIAEGEELCICYGTLLANRAERRAKLQSYFRFVCNCVACAREGAALKASDDRRVTISRLYDEIAGCESKPAVGIRKVKEALKLLEAENLPDSYGDFYYDALQFCISVADVRNAKAWARKAWEGYCVTCGPNSREAAKMKTYVQDPRAHPAFDLLPRKTLVGPD